MRTPIIAAGLVGLASIANAQDTLTVYTYDSFVAEWGPGPVIEKAFEARCDCDLEFVAVGDGAEILSRLRLEGLVVVKATMLKSWRTKAMPTAAWLYWLKR